MMQHRVSISPTVTLYSRGSEEESNRVIRHFSSKMPCFTRLNFITDQWDKGFYANPFNKGVLGYIHSVMQFGISLGNR